MAILQDLLAAIPVYTGLSPVSFFTIAAILIALYYLVAGFFAPPPPPPVRYEPPPPPVQLGDVTEEDLRAYDGSDPSKPLLMAIKGQIYDVSQSRMFYGPGGPYALFAGKDASRALAKMSFEEADLTGNIEGLSTYELDALQEWEWKFTTKYVKVGQIVNSKKDNTKEQDDSSICESEESSIKEGRDVKNGGCECIDDEHKVHNETREVPITSENEQKEQSTENVTTE